MAGIAGARADLNAMLAASGALAPDVQVVPYVRNIDAPAVPTVMVKLDKVTKSTAAGGLWDLAGELVLIVPQTEPGPADVALDDLLSDVLVALDVSSVAAYIHWTEATRGTYPPDNPTNPAYVVAVNLHTAKEQ